MLGSVCMRRQDEVCRWVHGADVSSTIQAEVMHVLHSAEQIVLPVHDRLCMTTYVGCIVTHGRGLRSYQVPRQGEHVMGGDMGMYGSAYGVMM